MTTRNYSSTTQPTSLTSGCTAVAVTLNVAATSGFPAVPFTIGVDRGTVSEEVMLVTTVTSNTMTVTRGFDGTTGAIHSTSAPVEHCVSALDYREANAHIEDTSRDNHTQYQTLARQKVYHPVVYNGTAVTIGGGLSLNNVTASAQTVNSLTIAPATFSRKVQVTTMIPLDNIQADTYTGRIVIAGSLCGAANVSFSTITAAFTLTAISDWIVLATGTSISVVSDVHATATRTTDVVNDPNLNKLSALVIANI